ncbi:hypothetical protein Y032_0473g2097 [Ancylostoma ceylanicum]|uniref:Uncharacterized protein n=1 Tax=Ancylostoma ceylanicum TaxID=53326 RepID=A0A016WWP1_9BILA|nr:hypothetical protein Y032_0473g2097 [Ancylostoma ceylanicum]
MSLATRTQKTGNRGFHTSVRAILAPDPNSGFFDPINSEVFVTSVNELLLIGLSVYRFHRFLAIFAHASARTCLLGFFNTVSTNMTTTLHENMELSILSIFLPLLGDRLEHVHWGTPTH